MTPETPQPGEGHEWSRRDEEHPNPTGWRLSVPRTLPRPVVTIAAEHGAWGDLVAPRVADALGVPFLDRALPASLAAAVEESERQSPLVGRLARASTMLASQPVERIDREEARIRDELAEFLARASTDGGVVLGRGGAVVLAGSPTALHVLLSGDRQSRVARVAEREGVGHAEADRRVRALDRARREYARRVFGLDTDDRTLYHLIVDTVVLGIDASVELVLAACRARLQQLGKENGS
jgi:cytidylate kinase